MKSTIIALMLLARCITFCAVAVASSPAIAQTGNEGLADGSGSGEAVELSPYGEEETERVDTVDEELVNYITPDASSYFEGDIVLTSNQRAIIEQETGEPLDPHEPQRAITRHEEDLWADGKVPYVISGSLSSRARSAIQAAISEYATKTCIEFTPRRSERNYVYFIKGSGCYSNVGRVGGRQDISIGSGCEYKGIVMHEMFHALGRWHEQSRPDRDTYVTINYNNIRDGVKSNFHKLSTGHVKTQGIGYDYGSVMHYSAYAFSRNGRPTIEPKDRSVRNSALGQRQGFSSRDLEHINVLYCDRAPSGSWSTWGSWSACSRSCNGGTRTRTRTCVGGASCPGSNIQTGKCNTKSCPVPSTWSKWDRWSDCSKSCGGGRQSRTRHCLNGGGCSGPSTVYRDCNEQACPGKWSSWSAWNKCSASCGGGTQTRSRTCLSEPCSGGSSRSRDCNTESCAKVPSVAGVEHKGCYRVLGDSGVFLLEGRAAVLKGESAFRRTDPVRKCAQAATQFPFSVFGVAAGYCISGNNRLADYTRVRSDVCKDGKGGYRNSAFYMDVYTISDPDLFRSNDSPQILSDFISDEQGQAPSSSSLMRPTLLATLVVVLLSLLTVHII